MHWKRVVKRARPKKTITKPMVYGMLFLGMMLLANFYQWSVISSHSLSAES